MQTGGGNAGTLKVSILLVLASSKDKLIAVRHSFGRNKWEKRGTYTIYYLVDISGI